MEGEKRRMGSGERVVVLLCASDSDYVRRNGGHFGMFFGTLSEDSGLWDISHVVASEFPNENKIVGYDGFIITGSYNDVHGNNARICKVSDLLEKLESRFLVQYTCSTTLACKSFLVTPTKYNQQS
ncbi:glucosinolate gamma-glutamyl hydrolase [Sarracenia purpurea var. burkii]